ncbi:MAG TPA: YbhB/YbcL family Raf kinase inhibitor-like protein [Terracidiphilus sp.]|nr:YbhB/YbcL family Raf kinase inhibitor-like protein [Terracidiphilus sp.]
MVRTRQKRLGLTWIVVFIVALAGCHSKGSVVTASESKMELTSSNLQSGQIPLAYTCDGANISPQLSWSDPPPGTESLALIVTDPDAPSGTFTHWILFNLPASSRSLSPGVPEKDQLADGSRQGENDFDRTGYGGPCPPHHSDHRYVFTLYALDTTLDLPVGASKKQVDKAIKNHVLARGELTAHYGRE